MKVAINKAYALYTGLSKITGFECKLNQYRRDQG